MHVLGQKHSDNRETLLCKLLIFDRSLKMGGGGHFPRFYDTQKSWSGYLRYHPEVKWQAIEYA